MAVSAILLVVFGCGEVPVPERSPAATPTPESARRHYRVSAETLWTRGGSENDTLVSLLRGLHVIRDRLELTDGGSASALSVATRDGRTVTVDPAGTAERRSGQHCPAANHASWQLITSEPYPLVLRGDSTIERRQAWPWPGLALEPALRRQAWLVPGRR